MTPDKTKNPEGRSDVLGPNRKLLTYPEVAEWLNVSVSKLRKDIALGRGPASVKIGRSCRFRSEDVQAFVEGNLTN